MSTRDQFGKYLLLKKLSEDPLGEMFRAGQIGGQGMDRVVLLRVFNGPGLRGDELWQGISARKDLLELLRSPNLAEGVDAGQVHGVPYVAWDYVSGKDLRTLMDQAEKQFSPIPTDQGLLIAERMALGLEVAQGFRSADGQRIFHGFLVPHLVLVSNEGDTRLLGFEAATSLRRLALASPTANHFRPFVSPEAQAGGAPQKSDDVFALGSILFELLSGQKLPPASAEGFGPVVDRATLANEGTPIPPEVAALLKKSLAPAGQRIDDVTAWHKEISKILFEGSYNPTTFNLAFFMHNLFRDEIEKESEEIEAERTMEVPVQAAPEPPAAAAAPAGPLVEDTAAIRERYAMEEGGGAKSKTGLFVGIAAAVVAAAAIGFFVMRGGGGESATSEPAAATPAAAPVPAAPDPAAQAELDAKMQELQGLIEQQQKMLEASQEAAQASNEQEDAKALEVERQLAELRKQLQSTEQKKREAELAATEAQAAEPEEEEVAEAQAPSEEAGEVSAMPQEAGTQAAQMPATSATATSTTATAPPKTTPAAAGGSPAGGQTARPTPPPAGSKSETAPPPPRQTPAQPAQAPKQESSVRPGELVTPGPGVVPPILQRPPRPRFPPMAKRLNKRATVAVNVLVDEKGRVIEAQLSGEKAGFGFDEAALQAARDALYKPATKDDVPVKIWVELKIAFQ